MQPVAAGRPGLFDADAVTWGWFDDCGQDQGWFDSDLLVYPEVVPPPPPPPPVPVRRRHRVSGGGGGGGSGGGPREESKPYCPPDWLRPWLPDLLPFVEDEEELKEEEAHYAFLHVTSGAVIRAMADGVVSKFVDDKGRLSVVLKADDETRYWYADIGASLVADGECVKAGQLIARTKPDASSVPTITQGASKSLPEAVLDAPVPDTAPPEPVPLLTAHVGDAVPLLPSERPTQVVFVEAPPLLGDAPPPPPPAPPAPRRLYKLVPISPPPDETPRPTTAPSVTGPILRVAARVGVIATLLYLLSLLDRPPTPPKKPRRPPPSKRTKRRTNPPPPKRRPPNRRRWKRRTIHRRRRLR